MGLWYGVVVPTPVPMQIFGAPARPLSSRVARPALQHRFSTDFSRHVVVRRMLQVFK